MRVAAVVTVSVIFTVINFVSITDAIAVISVSSFM